MSNNQRTPIIYVSTDIEADGPIPGPHSMLSIGSVAITETGDIVDSFSENLLPLEGATGHPNTMAWWATQPKAWAAVQENRVDADAAMRRYCAWLRKLPGKPVFVSLPAGFDFTFVYWYLIRFAGESPFGFAALDIKSFAMGLTGKPFRKCAKRYFPREWFKSDLPHTHIALDDAMEQAHLFAGMLRAWGALHATKQDSARPARKTSMDPITRAEPRVSMDLPSASAVWPGTDDTTDERGIDRAWLDAPPVGRELI